MKGASIMLSIENIDFLISCDKKELEVICDEISRESFNGAKNKLDLLAHITRHHKTFENFEKDINVNDVLRNKCHDKKCKIERIVCKHQKMLAMFERNLMQIELIKDHGINSAEWVERYGKKFAELVDEKCYRDIESIKFYLYKE